MTFPALVSCALCILGRIGRGVSSFKDRNSAETIQYI
jgi:hypothetical protein